MTVANSVCVSLCLSVSGHVCVGYTVFHGCCHLTGLVEKCRAQKLRVLKVWPRSLSAPASLPLASNHKVLQTTPLLKNVPLQCIGTCCCVRCPAHSGVPCRLLHVCHAPGFQACCQPRYASDMDPKQWEI